MEGVIETSCREGLLEETLQSFVNGSNSLPFINVQSSSALFAVAVYAKTRDAKLAQQIIEAGLQPAALIQPNPHLTEEAEHLLDSKKHLLCSALGLPSTQHQKREFDEISDDAEERPQRKAHTHTLHDASYLTGMRLRVSLANASPHYWRNKEGEVVCNGCLRTLGVTTDNELRETLYTPAWSSMRWKTFLCASCRERASVLDDAQTCHSCWQATADVEHIPLRYAEIDNPEEPRKLPLCPSCKERSHAQLSTVIWVRR